MTKTVKERFEQNFFLVTVELGDEDGDNVVYMFDKNETTLDEVYNVIDGYDELCENEDVTFTFDDYMEENNINFFNVTYPDYNEGDN